MYGWKVLFFSTIILRYKNEIALYMQFIGGGIFSANLAFMGLGDLLLDQIQNNIHKIRNIRNRALCGENSAKSEMLLFFSWRKFNSKIPPDFSRTWGERLGAPQKFY